MENGNGFIKFYNCFMEKGEYKLTPREWYFYSLLAARWSPFLGICETTVTAITDVQTAFQDKSRPTRDKTNTWEQIKSLELRGLIQILDDNIITGTRYNYDSIIKIKFNDFDDGFEQINPELYYLSSDPVEIYFLCVISRFNNKGFSHTYEGLSDLLCCSESNAQDLVKRMKKKKLITYVQGKPDRLKDGTYTRTANTYYLNKDDKSEVENEEEIKDVNIVVNDKVSYLTIFGELTLQEIQRKIKQSNWGTKEFLKEDDIDIMLTCEDIGVELSFTNKSRNTLKSWTKKGNDMNSINKWIESFHSKVTDKKLDWDKKKKEESMVNAVVINGEIVLLHKKNVDQIDFNLVDEIYYFDNDGSKPVRGNFKHLAGDDGVSEEIRMAATREYQRIVKLGNRLTMKLINEIREKVKGDR
jgi:hypothetical protein